MRKPWPIMVLLLLAGCASGAIKSGELSFLYTYNAALRDFEHGRIMEARRTVLNMDKSRADYPQAQKLLKEKIEPARRKLFHHYLSQARKAKEKGQWWLAKKFYAQAAQFSLQPARYRRAAQAMDARLRQLRLDVLGRQRRREDAALLAWAKAYQPPMGLPADDAVFTRMAEQHQDLVDERATHAYLEAKRYLRHGHPEAALVEVDSHLRLRPDSRMGIRLRQDIIAALPAGVKPPPAVVPAKPAPQKAPAGLVQPRQIRDLLAKGELLKARAYALAYQRQGGKGADRLLQEVDRRLAKEAAAAFQRGRAAFRQERLGEAVRHWRRAVALRPDEAEYSENLERAEALMERLRILRSAEGGKE